MSTFLPKAAAEITEAVKLDAMRDFQRAADKYMAAVAIFMEALQDAGLSSDERIFVAQKVSGYVNRSRQMLSEFANELACNVDRSVSIDDVTDSEKQVPVRSQDHHRKVPADRESGVEIDAAIVISKPNVQCSDVVGVDDAKRPLQEAIILPMMFPHTPQAKFAHKGLLIFGPGGVGKTQICKALATEANNATFFNVRPDMLMSKWVGESEKLVRQLFESARARKPSIFFFDEVDSFCASRTDDTHRFL